MKRVFITLFVWLAAFTVGGIFPRSCFAAVSGVPNLDELAGQWQDAASLRSLPALNSTCGSAKAAQDVLAIGNVSFPPVTMSGGTGGLLIDGKAPVLKQTRWFPYQILRKGTAGSIGVETSVRMFYTKDGFLFHVVLTNTATSSQSFQLEINLSAFTSRHKSWGWDIPRDRVDNRFSVQTGDGGRSLLLADATNQLANVFCFATKPDELTVNGNSGAAVWRVTLPPHAVLPVDYVLAVGEQAAKARTLAVNGAKHFSRAFAQVQTDWQNRFDAMFTPGSPDFSGHLPTLVTADERLRRVYYVSAVSLLCTLRTCFPVAPRVYVSNSPEFNCIMEYFWDTREWATTLALLDPAMLKQYLRGWLAKDIYRGYAQEFLTGSLQGPWYSANDFSVFVQLDDYLNITGDQAFLAEKINGQTVLQHMDAIATHWKQLVRPGRTLADYGEAGNLLECVPTYIHEVPSFNAANVWMMRRLAVIEAAAGNPARAAELRADARRLLPAVLALYEPGQGVWDSRHRDGQRVEMRHVFDYATIGLTIKDDLTSQTRREMTGFVKRELLTDHWMRAQSLSDPAAGESDRPDHGPMGAFSAWPAETMAVMCEFGQYNQALDFMHRIAPVTEEGPFSQSRELLGKMPDAPVRIASRGEQTYNVSSGASFDETIIREFFGYQPDFLEHKLVSDSAPRGFQGELLNVWQGNGAYDIISSGSGIKTVRRGPAQSQF